MVSTCRLCLLEDRDMFPLFSEDDWESQTFPLVKQVLLCTSLVITPKDNLPQKICKKCLDFIRKWSDFRMKSLESDSILKKNFIESKKDEADPEPIASPITNTNKSHKNRTIVNTVTNHCYQLLSASEDSKVKKTSRSCCSYTFLTKISYRLHMKECHTKVDLSCDECGKKGFSSKVTLRRHKLLHSKRHQCSFCPKAFTCKALMRVHERAVHENDLPFVCDICGKAFVTKLCLTYHQRFHYDERNYMCEVCGVPFVTNSALHKHKATHSNVRPHVCEMCGKGFIVPMRLVEHMRLHTGERPYACDLCDKSYPSSCKLKRHKKSHHAIGDKK